MIDSAKRHKLTKVKNLFLKGVLGVYVIAFASLYVQVKAIFGDEGVVPISDLVKKTGSQKSPLEAYNIVLLAPKLGLSYATFLELVCLTSVLVATAGLLSKRFCNALSFGLLWYVYYSIHQVGQGFMSFHSDFLLLEVGFLSMLLAPLVPKAILSSADHDHLPWFLVRWIVFRYFVTYVINVYTDDDNAFYNLSAIPIVAQSVPFPSILTWHLFNLPVEYQQLLQAFEHTLKLTTPFLFVLDFKYTRFFAFYTLLFISIGQALFFNFGYTDLLISVSLISVLKDSYFYQDVRAKQSTIRSLFDVSCLLGFVAFVTHLQVHFFGITYANNVLSLKPKFTPGQVKLLVTYLVPAALAVGVFGYVVAVYKVFFSSSRKTPLIKTLAYSLLATALFISTFPTLTRFHPSLEHKLKHLKIKEFNRLTAPLKLSNNYLIVSKVSQHYADGRPELTIQSRESPNVNSWDQFDLRYKPGQQSRELKFVVPHLPRLDLKMWYAARSSLTNNQWLQTFVYRLATRQSDVLKAVAQDNYIAKSSQVRVALYNYKYSLKSKQPFAGYWSQVKFVEEYMPMVSVDSLKQTVKSNGVSLSPVKSVSDKSDSFEKLLNKYLEISSDYIRSVNHAAVIWTLMGVVVMSLMR